MAHRGKIRRIDDDTSFEDAPGMIVEVAAHHLPELLPLVERSVTGVCPDDALSILFDERHEVSLLLLTPVSLAGDEQKDRVEVVEVFCVPRGQRNWLLGNPLRVSAYERVV